MCCLTQKIIIKNLQGKEKSFNFASVILNTIFLP